MLELGAGADILRGLGWLYIGLIVVLVGVALWFPERWWQKVISVIVVLLIFIGPAYLRNREKQQLVDERKAHYEKAKALFEARCKTAGEKIFRTVENVEGFVWEKWRPLEINYGSQFKLTDPYGRDCGGEECIKPMLRVTSGAELNAEDFKRHAGGYSFVETIDPADNIMYRYTGVVTSVKKRTVEQMAEYRKNTGREPTVDVYGFALNRETVEAFVARYRVTWDDVSTPEDRNYWIAGGAIRIVDIQTGEVIAERTGYLMDPGQGSTNGQRSPWTWARSSTKACPSVDGHNLKFIQSVLEPKQGE